MSRRSPSPSQETLQAAALVKKVWSSRQLPTVSFRAAGAVYASGASCPVPHSPSNNIPDSSSPVTASVPTSLSRAWMLCLSRPSEPRRPQSAARLKVMARGTTTSGQMPDTLRQADRSIKPLATHGRANHLGRWRRLRCVHAPSGYAPKLTRSAGAHRLHQLAGARGRGAGAFATWGAVPVSRSPSGRSSAAAIPEQRST
jgi:hypothetical protein